MGYVKVRCKGCGLLLGEFAGSGKIKCRKCHGMNEFDGNTGKIKYKEASKVRERERKTLSGLRFN
jgi:LSD1 subclass zinc finger protein